MNLIPRKAAAVCAAFVAVILLLTFSLLKNSGLIPGANEEADKRIELLEAAENRKVTVEGQFLDRNGYPITQAEQPGKPAQILFDECYSHLLGYRSPIYGTSGLRHKLSDHLLYGGADNVGATVTLTTDNLLQQYCYDLLAGMEGSIIVLNADTGAILACASRSDADLGYNANQIDTKYAEYVQHDAFFLNPALIAQDTAGSCFKVITAAAMLENGMEQYTYTDSTGVYSVGGAKIHNYGGQVFHKTLNLESAFRASANVYFASAGVKLNGRNLYATASRFLLGEKVELDFCTLNSVFDLGNFSNQALLAQTSFGQGKVAVSPLMIATWMGAVMNDGEIMKPYLLETIVDDGETIYQTTPALLSQALDADTAQRLQYYLHSNATHYGFSEEVYGKAYAKTGTSDQANGKNHIYYLVGVELPAGRYAILVDRRNCHATSGALKNTAADVLAFLLTSYATETGDY